MEIQENQLQESWSDTASNSSSTRVGRSGPLSGPLVSNKKTSSKRSARFKEEEYVEITLDVRDDSVSVQNIKGGDSETTFLASQLEKRHPSLGSQLSFRLRQVSQELKRMTSSQRFDKFDRTKSGAARALKGLKFMTKNVGSEGWSEVEARFDDLAVNGALPKTRFGQCIGNHVPNSLCPLIWHCSILWECFYRVHKMDLE
uniref:Respiratory burst oxidase protein B n=1 Tax=Rhizophora mucronata TaxID=61149 RepID=A0A2P2KE11_RHIMU